MVGGIRNSLFSFSTLFRSVPGLEGREKRVWPALSILIFLRGCACTRDVHTAASESEFRLIYAQSRVKVESLSPFFLFKG